MKDAGGHGSNGRGGGDSKGAAQSRFHGSIKHQVARGQYNDKPVTFGHALADQFKSKLLGANAETALTAKFGSSTAHQMVLAAQHGVPTAHLDAGNPANSHSAFVNSVSDKDLVDISRGQRQTLRNAELRQKASQTGE